MLREAPSAAATASDDAERQQRVDLQRRLHRRRVAPAAERDRRQLRRLRLDQRLAEVEGEAGAEQHQRDADGDVVDARQRAEQAVQQRQQRAARAAPASTPSQGEPLR